MNNLSSFNLSKGLNFLFLFSIFLWGFTGCQQDYSLNSVNNEKEQIIESNEFLQYIKSHLTFVNKMTSIQNTTKSLGSIENKSVFYASKDVLELYNNVISSRSALITKYPSFNLLSDEEKNDLFEKAILK